jgi:hypothetical protein
MPQTTTEQARAPSGATAEQCLEAMREYQTQKRRCSEENGSLRSIVKRWKAAGVPVKAMIVVCEASKRDHEDVKKELREVVRLMILRRLIGPETDLFAGMDLRVAEKARHEDDIWTAEDRGIPGWTGWGVDR